MKKPLQHRILDLLADGPMNFGQLCERLVPEFSNRKSVYGALKAMQHTSKVRVCGQYKREGVGGDLAIWELAPAVSNALFDAWPMPVLFPPVPGTVRKHRLEL